MVSRQNCDLRTYILGIEPANPVQRELHLHHGRCREHKQSIRSLADANTQGPVFD